MQSGQDLCGDDGSPSNHQRIFAKKSEIKMDGILGTHRRMLIEHEIFVFCGCRQQLDGNESCGHPRWRNQTEAKISRAGQL